MTDTARDLWRRVRRGPLGLAAAVAPAGEILVVTPSGTAAGLAEELAAQVDDAANRIVAGLRIGKRLVVRSTRTGGSDTVEVSCFGRPVALVSGQLTPESASRVTRSVHDGLVARPSVLQNPLAATLFGRTIADWVGDEQARRYTAVAGHLLDAGIAMREPTAAVEREALRAAASAGEAAEVLINAWARPTVEVSLPESVLRAATDESLTALPRCREALFIRTGVRFPNVVITLVDDELGLQVQVNDVTLPVQPLGPAPSWESAAQLLTQLIEDRAHWLALSHESWRPRDVVAGALPELAALAGAVESEAWLSACLRAVLRGGGSLANLPRLQWLLLEMDAPSTQPDRVRLMDPPRLGAGASADARDPELAAVTVRRRSAEDKWQSGIPSVRTGLVALAAQVEASLVAAIGTPEIGEAEWAVVRAIAGRPEARVVVTHSASAVAPVRSALTALGRPLRVIASEELPPDEPMPTE